MEFLKAIAYMVLGIVVLFGSIVFLLSLSVAWPVLLVLLLFGLPFLICGVLAGKSGKKQKEKED